MSSRRFASKRGLTTPRIVLSRADWIALGEEGLRLARLALTGGRLDHLDLCAFRAQLNRAGESEIPVAPATKHPARNGFMGAARGFEMTEGATSWAQLLELAAEIVLAMIEAHRTEAAASWQSRLGD